MGSGDLLLIGAPNARISEMTTAVLYCNFAAAVVCSFALHLLYCMWYRRGYLGIDTGYSSRLNGVVVVSKK